MSTSGGVTIGLSPSGDTSGVKDTAAIQALINQAASGNYPNQGGLVQLAIGTYYIKSPLQIPVDNITLAGANMGNPAGNKNTNSNPQYGGTVLQCVPGFSGSQVLQVGQTSPTRVLSGIDLHDFSIDMQSISSGTPNGIFWQAFRSNARNVYVNAPQGNGIVIDGNGSVTFPNDSFDNCWTRCMVNAAGGNGWVYQNDATDNVMLECWSFGNTGHGFYADSTSNTNRWNGGYAYSNGGKGIQLDTGFQMAIVGFETKDSNGGIYITTTGEAEFKIVGCTIRNPSHAADNTTDGINISGTGQGGMIGDNTFTIDQGIGNGTGPNFNRARYLINIAAAGVNYCVIGPYRQGTSGAGGSWGTAFVQDLGTNTQILAAIGQSGLPEIKHSGNLRMLWRSGSPAGAVTAGPGSIVFNTAGGAGTTLFVKESATDTSGWVGK